MPKSAAEVATELLVAALQSGKIPGSTSAEKTAKEIGDAFKAIYSAVNEAFSMQKR